MLANLASRPRLLLLCLSLTALVIVWACGGTTEPASTPTAGPSSPTAPPPSPPPSNPSPGPQPASAQVSVTTYHYDVARTGVNPHETVLTPGSVNAANFGKLYSFNVDGQIYGQPLYLPGVSIAGATHNVVFVATEHDSVYAFDADNQSSAPLWKRSFIDPAHGVTTVSSATDFLPVKYQDISPEIGITSTPVIDPSSGTIYVVAATKENGIFFQRLHALDIATGAEKSGGPVEIHASMPGKGAPNDGNGNIVFDPLIANQRSALLLQNGVVYLAFASHNDINPFLGWILGYDAATLKQAVVFAPTPDAVGGGVWEAGNGPAVDSAGNMYAGVANGDYSADRGLRDYGDSFIKVAPSNGTLQVLDWFTPFDFKTLNDLDQDVGSGGPILLPDQSSGPPHLLAGGSKAGQLYIVNRDNMGHNHQSDNGQAVQQIGLPAGLFGNPAAWKSYLYVQSSKSPLQCYTNSGGRFALTSQGAETFDYPGGSPVVSSNGDSGGIVWVLQTDQFGRGPAVLHAYDATDCTHELYDSSQQGSRDTAAGTAVKFSVPTIANGKVFVAAGGALTVYGPLH